MKHDIHFDEPINVLLVRLIANSKIIPKYEDDIWHITEIRPNGSDQSALIEFSSGRSKTHPVVMPNG